LSANCPVTRPATPDMGATVTGAQHEYLFSNLVSIVICDIVRLLCCNWAIGKMRTEDMHAVQLG